jgi:phenylalanyl-tRNA synthetase beta chain
MKISLSWLQEYLETSADVETIVNKLIQLGHELDGVEDEGKFFSNVVIGKVIAREKHPDADRLSVCTVDVGEDKKRTIVCGAPNVREGITVSVALPGAILPGDFAIKASKIRGVASEGMICSVRELGLGDEHEGIWEMETDAKIGTPLSEAMDKNDTILEVAVTPNRGDCLNVYGIARDLAAAGVGTLKPLPEVKNGEGKNSISAKIESKNTPAFNGIEITGVTNGESPMWLKRRIEQAGMRPRNLAADVTNYTMLTFGQPLHSYDGDKVSGTIVARDAKGGEEFTGIGDVELKLNEGDITICDDSGVIGLGGILGGIKTAMTGESTRIYLEGAWFDRSRIARTGQNHQLITDARYRFERGIDPAMTVYALNWAADMIVSLGGGKRTEVDIVGSCEKQVATIEYAPSFCKTFGGLEIEASKQAKILSLLGFTGKMEGEKWSLTAPTWRTYMENPEDIVEELLRVEDYETVPTELPEMVLFKLDREKAAPMLKMDRTARRALASQGFLETITYSFIKHEHAKHFANGQKTHVLDNPLDEDTMSTMRPSLLPGLLVATSANIAKGEATRLMGEVGTIFGDEEKSQAAGIITSDGARHWQGDAAAPEAYAAKAAAQAVLANLGVNVENLQISTDTPAWFHPGRSGNLVLGKTVLATFGEVHPATQKLFGLKSRVMAFTVDLNAVGKQKTKQKAFTVSNYPAVQRDLAFVLDESITADQVVKTVRNATRPLVQSVDVFDVYQGKGVPEGKKSLAIALTLRADDRTLTEDDISPVMNSAVEAISKHYNGELRS